MKTYRLKNSDKLKILDEVLRDLKNSHALVEKLRHDCKEFSGVKEIEKSLDGFVTQIEDIYKKIEKRDK